MIRTLALTLVVIAANVVGNLLLSLGMKTPAGALSPWVLAGVALLILWTLTRMALLSRADLTFVLPVTAVGYPLNSLAGALFLHEQITPQRWLGTALIVAGAVLVGLSAARRASA